MAYNTCFNDLPTEIIEHIFQQGTLSQQTTNLYGIPHPMLISQVCTTWRIIAISSPRLWTVVVVPLFYQPAGLACLTATNNLIQRSGSLPISVILNARFRHRKAGDLLTNSGVVSAAFMQTMLQGVIELAGDRLRRLDICIPFYAPLSPKDYSIIDRASSLEELTVVCARIHLPFEPTALGSTSLDLRKAISLPRLQKLRWCSPILPKVTNLTSFSATALEMSYLEMQSFFKDSPNLSHLILNDIRPITDQEPQQLASVSFEVPSLTHVAIKCYREINPQEAYIFTFFQIDHLSYLELDGTISITKLFGRSIPSIAESLQTLLIANYSDASLNSREDRNDRKRDVEAIQSFHNLRHLYLLRAPSQIFNPIRQPQSSSLRRSGSISRLRSERAREANMNPMLAVHGRVRLRDTNELGAAASESKAPVSESLWPHVRHVMFDSLLAMDVSVLCNWTKEHPTLALLELSGVALRHVTGSVQRKGDVIFPMGWKAYQPIVDEEDTEALQDVKDWISKRVELRVMEEQYCGLIYNRVFNALGEDLPWNSF